jgi:DNA-binding phage protein
MSKIKTIPYDVAKHLRTPQKMALYVDACIAESGSTTCRCQNRGLPLPAPDRLRWMRP